MEIELINGFENAVLIDGVPDRVYEAEDINKRFEGLVSPYGVFANIEGACKVVAGTNLKVVVKAGKGEINNHWFKIESDTEIELEASDVILNRIDSIIIRRTSENRNIILTVKKGELATTPIAPSITRTESVQEICLANIYIGKNATSISTANITDTRANNSLCGYIACLVDQLNTTELFDQYEDAQNNFINNQTTQFENWFETVKDDVRATSLYREYEALYKTSVEGEQTITIPSSINYVNNGIDVLNVHINGIRLIKDSEYTINTSGTSITLKTPLELPNQDIIFINKKSIAETGAEEVIARVENLEGKVNDINKYYYETNGTNDNIILSTMVKNFLNGTGDYSTALDNSNLNIIINGTLGLDYSSDDALFDFQSNSVGNRKAYIDFSNATIPSTQSVTKTSYAIFYANNDVVIKNANIKIDNISATTLYIFHGGIIKESNVFGKNSNITNFYGAWGCEELSNSKINITGGNITNIAYGCDNVLYNSFIANSVTNKSINNCIRTIGNDYNGDLVSLTFDIANRKIN